MSHTLVPVSASNEEHSCTIGDSSYDSTAGNDSTGGVHLLAAVDVTSHGTTVTGPTSRGGTRCSSSISGTVITWELASRKRASCVDQVGEGVDGRIFVVPESIGRVA